MKHKTVPARLDPNGTEEPLTRIIHHPVGGKLCGPAIPLVNPELEDQDGNRTPLTTHPVYGSFNVEAEQEFLNRPDYYDEHEW